MTELDAWRTVTLGSVLTSVKRPVRLQPTERYATLGVRWYAKGPFAKPTLPGTAIAAKTLNTVAVGDIVYSKLFAWKGSFGVISGQLDGVVASTEFPTYTASEDLLPAFFELWASRSEVWAEAELASTGTTANSRNRFAPEDFLDLELSLPPVETQQAIVSAVAAADAAGAESARQARATEAFFRAYRRDLFARLAADGAVPIREFAEVASGGTPSRRHPEYFGGGIPWVKTAEVGFAPISDTDETVAEEDLQHSSAKVFPADTVLVAMYGRGTVGRSAYITRPMATNQACAAIKPGPRHVPLYLFHFLWNSYDDLVDEAEGTTNLTNISLGIVGDFEVPLPDLRVQRDIAERLERVLAASKARSRVEAAYASFRAALVEDLVTGVRQPPSNGAAA